MGINGKVLAKSYTLHVLFSHGLFHGTIAVLFTILFKIFFLMEVLTRITEFMFRWGDKQGKQTFCLVVQGASLHGVLFLRFSLQLKLACKGMSGWSYFAWV